MAIIVKSPSWEHYPRVNLKPSTSFRSEAPYRNIYIDEFIHIYILYGSLSFLLLSLPECHKCHHSHPLWEDHLARPLPLLRVGGVTLTLHLCVPFSGPVAFSLEDELKFWEHYPVQVGGFGQMDSGCWPVRVPSLRGACCQCEQIVSGPPQIERELNKFCRSFRKFILLLV